MAGSIQHSLMESLQTAEGLYYRLVLLVGESGSGKTRALHLLARVLGINVINVNLALAKELVELTARQRMLQLPSLLTTMTDNGHLTAILDNTEILFDPFLKQDPLRLLKGTSRNRTIVASWNGKVESGRLTYAEPGHPEHHRRYELDGVLIVPLADLTITTELPQ